MLSLIQLIEKSSPSIHTDFNRWFATAPAAASWNVISDYCLGNREKQNDAFSFVILLNHDTFANIESYIAAVAPRDIKASRNPSQQIIDYLCCPVSFSFNFIVERQSSYLKTILTVQAMRELTSELQTIMRDWAAVEPPNAVYYGVLERRLNSLSAELDRRQPSLTLLRQIFLVATFAAVVLSMVNQAKSPIGIRWISDRDAMFDRHDGVAFDLAWLLFQVMRRIKGGVIDLRRPQLLCGAPGMDRVTEYAEFIRLPDFVAATLADMKLPQMMFTHRKFPPIFNQLFVDAQNNAVIELITSPDSVTSRRIAFKTRSTAA